mgnify:CR=1 FL=1
MWAIISQPCVALAHVEVGHNLLTRVVLQTVGALLDSSVEYISGSRQSSVKSPKGGCVEISTFFNYYFINHDIMGLEIFPCDEQTSFSDEFTSRSEMAFLSKCS